MNQALILDSRGKYLGILELENWREVPVLEGFFRDLILSDRWEAVFPSLYMEKQAIDVWNALSVSLRTNNMSVFVEIYGDEGMIELEITPLENINRIKKDK